MSKFLAVMCLLSVALSCKADDAITAPDGEKAFANMTKLDPTFAPRFMSAMSTAIKNSCVQKFPDNSNEIESSWRKWPLSKLEVKTLVNGVPVDLTQTNDLLVDLASHGKLPNLSLRICQDIPRIMNVIVFRFGLGTQLEPWIGTAGETPM